MSVFSRMYRGEANFQFVGHRRRWYIASAIIFLICVLSFVFRGFNWSIDFKGGSEFQINASGTSLTAQDVNNAFSKAGISSPNPAQIVGSGSDRQIVVQTGGIDPQTEDAARPQIAKALGISENDVSVTSVSSSWGHDITVKALEGLVVFLIVVSIYLTIRFNRRMATSALLALVYDIIVAAGVYSLVGFSVSPSTVVGLLTILGYSIYDRVVVFDKVAENTKNLTAGSRMTFSEAANLALNQTLMRSINTSLIALLPVAGLLFIGAGLLGVGTIKDLALVLLVGLACGAYSSLFLATPIDCELTERLPEYKALAKRVAAKRATEAARAAAISGEPALAGAGAGVGASRRTGAPAPAPRPGARPQRPRKR